MFEAGQIWRAAAGHTTPPKYLLVLDVVGRTVYTKNLTRDDNTVGSGALGHWYNVFRRGHLTLIPRWWR